MHTVRVRAGTRRSRLALKQTSLILEALSAAWTGLRVETEFFDTLGDQTIGALVPPPGGKGLFTAALEQALLSGSIDIAVHSLKDLPTATAPGLAVGAMPERASARDVLVVSEPLTLDTLPSGASVGTSSPRRAAQLRHYRRDLVIRPIRGNVDTRLAKMESGEVDAVVLAEAGLDRLGIRPRTAARIALEVMLPAPGQGALAVQCRAEDQAMLQLLAPLDCARTRRATMAERSFLSGLGGGCAAPIAALATASDVDGSIELDAAVYDAGGEAVIRVHGQGKEAAELGARLAREALGRGAKEVLSHA